MDPAPLILNVNDDDAARYLITKYLERASFRVVEAADGAAALRIATTSLPDLVVLDVKLPDMSGFLVARALREREPTAGIPILHASAHQTSRAHRVEGLESGADSYMTQPLDEDELIATVRALLRNRRAEQDARRSFLQWQAAFDAIVDAVCVVDTAGRLSQCNEAMALLLGRPVAALVGQPFTDVAAPILGPLVPALGQQAKPQSRRTELNLGERWFRASADRMFGADGAETGVIYFLSDITLQRRVEEHRDRLYLEAEASNRAKDEFLAMLSHELRTPLNAILGWMHLVQSGTLPAAAHTRALETVARNARQQQRLIEDVLDVSRIVNGKQSLNVTAFDVDEVVVSAIDGCRPAAEAKGIELRLEPGEALGTVSGDADRMLQILSNLLSNAIKFNERNGRVLVTKRRLGEDRVMIAVRDTGRGISPTFLPAVFERFRQADSSNARVHGGLGLGLAIVRYFVELHGGTVRAESGGEGLGSTFTVELPRITSYGDATALPRRPALDGPGSFGLASAELRGSRIVVVDDEEDARELVAKVFELHGADVVLADSAGAALRAIEAQPPDLLVSDIGMPDVTGLDLVREVRMRGHLPRALPAIALTAFARSEDGQRSLEAGFDMHLAKPVEPAALVSAVIMLVQRKRRDSISP